MLQFSVRRTFFILATLASFSSCAPDYVRHHRKMKRKPIVPASKFEIKPTSDEFNKKHDDAITGLRSIPAEVGEEVQGFLTNKNRFVDREEGYDIAELANQLNDRSRGGSRALYSEDLY